MLSPDEVHRLMTDLESDRVERTVAVRDTDKLAQAVCALANDFPSHRAPGYLVIGATDDGRAAGIAITDELLQNLAALRSDGNIQPLPALTVSRHAVDGGEVAVVEVLPSDMPPVRYRGRVWIRVGPRRAIASEQEERILTERRVASARTFDAQPCLEATLADLSEERFVLGYLRHAVSAEALAENGRPLKQKLASLRFFDLRADGPTNAGVLVLCERPTHFLPGAYVQFVRYEGSDQASAVIDEKRAMGDLPTVLQTLDLLLDVNIRQHPVHVSALREEMVYDYPRVALRELVINAVMHRNYASNAPVRLLWFSDHVEISNPGGLYGHATRETFPATVDYRNPVVAEAIRVLGYTNRFGQGVFRARRALELNGNPPPQFEFDAHWFAVRVGVRK